MKRPTLRPVAEFLNRNLGWLFLFEHGNVSLAGGGTMHIRGVEVFTVTDDGLISAVDAYWGDEDLTFD